jgi:hypothetical protein
MTFKCDDGYSMYGIRKIEDNKYEIIQIETTFVQKYMDLFHVETEFRSGVWTNEDVQEEINNIADFASGYLIDVIREKAYKISILTQEELEERSK